MSDLPVGLTSPPAGYAEWLAQDRAAEKKSGKSNAASRTASDNSAKEKPAAAVSKESAPGQRRPLLKESEKLEQQLAEWQGELKLLETRLADPSLYAGPEARLLDELTLRQNLLTQNIGKAESRWLEIHELLESTKEN